MRQASVAKPPSKKGRRRSIITPGRKKKGRRGSLAGGKRGTPKGTKKVKKGPKSVNRKAVRLATTVSFAATGLAVMLAQASQRAEKVVVPTTAWEEPTEKPKPLTHKLWVQHQKTGGKLTPRVTTSDRRRAFHRSAQSFKQKHAPKKKIYLEADSKPCINSCEAAETNATSRYESDPPPMWVKQKFSVHDLLHQCPTMKEYQRCKQLCGSTSLDKVCNASFNVHPGAWEPTAENETRSALVKGVYYSVLHDKQLRSLRYPSLMSLLDLREEKLF
jgi:hypothetical protein